MYKPKTKWAVCVGLDHEDIEIEAERYFVNDERGILKFMTAGRVITAFNRNGWLYFQEVDDDGPR